MHGAPLSSSSSSLASASDPALVHWTEGGQPRQARWLSPSGAPAPRRVVPADDTLKADAALRLISEGTALLWHGDFHNARQLLQALARRVDEKAARGRPGAGADPAQAFHRHRQAQAHRARILGGILLPLTADGRIPLRRAPDARAALAEVVGLPIQPPQVPPPSASAAQPDTGPAGPASPDQAAAEAPLAALLSLRELQGLIGGHEWRKKGVPIPALGESIHPHHGVFSPVRGEYVDLVARAPLPAALAPHPLALDVGTGTGVLAAVLARRGIARVIATDQDPRALACAADNLQRLGLACSVALQRADLFPSGASAVNATPADATPADASPARPCGAELSAAEQQPRFGLIVCNPPWVPAKPASPIEAAVYDPDSRMLRAFLAGAAAHLADRGEAWLILSDLAEHLGLRRREELLAWIEAGGLQVLGRLDARPQHPKAGDRRDPLHAARAAEVTSLWRLGRR